MKKFLNAPGDLVAEGLVGLVGSHPDLLAFGSAHGVVRRKQLRPGKVALVSGGGSGHEPLHVGFVGPGMLDAACAGAVFTSPTPDQIVAAVRDVDGGAGCLLVVKNYSGDVMNFRIAATLLRGEVATLVVDDDVATADAPTGGRGIAGTLVVEKILGAAAERGMSLQALLALGSRVVARTRSMGLAFSSAVVPATGMPTFELGEEEMELGVGIHGERGQRRVSLARADSLVQLLLKPIVEKLQPVRGSPCLLLVNGLGGTPLLELYLMAGSARAALQERGLDVTRLLVGNFVTSLEMAGCSLTVTLLDPEMDQLWCDPVKTAGLSFG